MAAACRYLENRALDCYEIFSPKDTNEGLGAVSALGFFSTPGGFAAGACYLGYKWATAEKLPPPNEVRDIYTPPQAQDIDWSPYRDQIDELRSDSDVVGVTMVPSPKTGELLPIYIKRCSPVDQETPIRAFLAHDLVTGKRIGMVQITPFLQENNYLEDHWLCGMPDEMKGYGADKTVLKKSEENTC